MNRARTEKGSRESPPATSDGLPAGRAVLSEAGRLLPPLRRADASSTQTGAPTLRSELGPGRSAWDRLMAQPRTASQ